MQPNNFSIHIQFEVNKESVTFNDFMVKFQYTVLKQRSSIP